MLCTVCESLVAGLAAWKKIASRSACSAPSAPSTVSVYHWTPTIGAALSLMAQCAYCRLRSVHEASTRLIQFFRRHGKRRTVSEFFLSRFCQLGNDFG